jgi:hypothetical protein
MVDEKKYLLRIEEDLKLYIARQARLNQRSLNKEIVYRLGRSRQLDNEVVSTREPETDSAGNKF